MPQQQSGWPLKKNGLGMVTKFGDLFLSQIPRKKLKNSDKVVFIGMQDVDENATIRNFTVLDYAKVKNGFTYFEKNDVLVAKITPCFENGKGGFAEKITESVGFGSTEFHILRAADNSDARYVYYHTKRPKFRLLLEAEMVGSAGHRRVPYSAIQEFELEFRHSKEEQTAIANALSDVDALIAALEKVINKKSAIKTAAMQQLLTGKKRLPPFDQLNTGYKQTELGEIPVDWELISLQNMVASNGLVRGPFGGAIKKEHFTKTGYKVYEQRNAIYSNIEIGNYYIDQKKFDELTRFSVSSGDFIVSCSGTIGRIYQIPEKYPKGVINQALLKITLNDSIDSKYFGHYFKWDVFQERITDGTQGGAMKNLVGMAEFKQSLMPLPKLKREQTAIANVLSDMDNDLEALQQRLHKTQQIKQGMMQELLTGKTRLVKTPGGAHE